METLIYVAIFGTVASALMGIVYNVTKIHSHQLAANEVDSNLRYALNLINEKVREATVIDSATSSTLVLKMPVSTKTTTFSVSSGTLYFQEGTGAQVAVTSNRVNVDSLIFEKISMAGAKGGVRINISLSYKAEGRPELSFTKSLLSTVSRASVITFDGDIVPGAPNAYDVGADSPRWKNGYFSGDVVAGTSLCIGADCKTSWGQVGITGSGTSSQVTFWTGSGSVSGDSGLFWNNTDKRLGIGTTTPAYKLAVQGDTKITGTLITAGLKMTTNPISGYVLKSDASGNASWQVALPSASSSQTLRHDGSNWTASSLVYNTDTYLGVGTSTPAVRLHVVAPVSTSTCYGSAYACSYYNNYDQATCEAHQTCTWSANDCFGLGQGACNSHSPDCTWDTEALECWGTYYSCSGSATACSTYTGQSTCQAQGGCTWGTLPNVAAAFMGGKVGIGTTSPAVLLDLGTAGVTAGVIRLAGSSSGNVTVQVAAAAGTWSMTLPTAAAVTSGYQLSSTTGGVTSWTIASSLRGMKDIIGTVLPADALNQILGTKNVYRFHYKPGMGTGDSDTEYVGVMADEAPWAMHYNGIAVNPVNTLGYMVLGIQALDKKISALEQALASLGLWIEDKIVRVKELIAEKIFAKIVKVEQLEMIDKSTGETYCAWIENGEWMRKKGECR